MGSRNYYQPYDGDHDDGKSYYYDSYSSRYYWNDNYGRRKYCDDQDDSYYSRQSNGSYKYYPRNY
jgi:hypothetical protein